MRAIRCCSAAVVGAGLVLAGCVGLEQVPDGADGMWTARRPGGGERVRLDLYRGPVGHRETERLRLFLDLGEVEGLDAGAFRDDASALSFRIERPAGTLVFEGRHRRRPAGSFRLEPSPSFVARLAQLGLTSLGRDRLVDLAIQGMSLDLVESLRDAGYVGGDADDLLRLQDYGLTPEWIAAMARLGRPTTVEDLLTLRRHGIGPLDVERWVAAGIADLGVDDLLRLHNQGLLASDAASYRALGFDDIEDWLTFRRYGVRTDLIAAVVESAAARTDADAIVGLHVNGTDADRVREAAPLIEAGFDWDALLSLWRRGVSSDYAVALIESGWAGLDEEAIAQMAINGLEPEWILRVRAAAANTLDVSDLVDLHRHGIGAQEYESYARDGYLEAADVVLLHNAGVDAAFLRRLAEAGFAHPDPHDAVEAARRGFDEWIERNRP